MALVTSMLHLCSAPLFFVYKVESQYMPKSFSMPGRLVTPSLYEPHGFSNRSTKEYGLPAKSENMKIRIMKPDEMENSRTR